MSKSTVTTTSWRAFLSLVRIEFRLNVREPSGLVVGLGMPVLLVVVFGSIPTFQTAIMLGRYPRNECARVLG